MTTRAITPAEYRKLLLHAPMHTRLALRVAWETGLRVSDILGIKTADVKAAMTITERKTGNQRSVTLSPSLVHALRDYGRSMCDDNGRAIPVHRTTVYRTIRAIAAACDMGPGVSMHSVRKSWAQRYAKEHGLTATQHALGHRSKITTLIYVSDLWAADQQATA